MTIASELNLLLAQGVTGNQTQLVEALKKRNIHTTQSSVSRALKKINAVKVHDNSGNTLWTLGRKEPRLKDIGFFDSLVKKVVHNGVQIVIHTRPGTANTVAKFIDDHGFDQVMGSVAGDDTIFIAPAHVDLIRETVQKITAYMKQIGIFVE